MDLDPFEPVGIRARTMRFLDCFLLHCLLADSPPDSPEEIVRLATNQHRAAARGREAGLKLDSAQGELPLTAWAGQLLDELQPIAQALAAAMDDEGYLEALQSARDTLAAPDTLPSARVLQAMADRHGCAYIDFVRQCSRQAKQAVLALPYAPDLQARFEAEARASVAEQERIEAADSMPFEIYRQQYLAPERLGR